MSATSTNNNNTHDNDNESYSHSNPRVDDLEYTFTTHGPNDDYIWPHTGSPFSMPLNIQTGGRLARASPSPGYSEHWQSPEYNSYNSQNEQSSNSPTFLLNNYSPDSALGPYGVHSRSPHISPTGSDPTLSPLYSSSPHLSPSTPNSSFMPSPTLTDINHLVMIDQSTIGSSDPKLCYTHREQLLKFREALSLPMPGAGPFVPQPMYKPHTTSDRKRYVEEVMLEAPMFFISEHPEQYGISLKDALHSRTKKLRDRDMVVFEGRGPSVSIRLEWPGYRQWSRQIPTKDFRSPPQPITLAKLAKNVAKCVQRFMQDRKHLPMEEESDHRWKIGDGPDDIKLEDLILVSIHHVSLGSWQPHLRLVRPLRQQRYGNGHGHGQSHSLSVPQMPPTPMTASNSSPSTISFSQLS
ncbi:hypothetical protein JR316_0008080 [Psilocybe cubensis]|uniref:Uncharacterized protein n=2 Tax=Psilocybe cubensis TaxID=181762 RepID=A0ACB8GW85_PSICU|nr:hypothetical protein JR316_0008080 [Psilocybe cubensis]KAH9479486.1 hypothetical protein JR316_0008080 [Psilocybe cubensis]